MVRRDDSYWHDMVSGDDDVIRGHGHDRVEVARREGVSEVSGVIGNKGVDEGEIRAQSCFDEVLLAVDFQLALVFFNDGAEACWGQDATEAIAATTNTFYKRALRHQLHLEFPSNHLLLCLWVQADVADDAFPEQPRRHEFANTHAGHGGIIGDHR